MKKRLNKEQRKAVKDYEFALRQEDRYMGSVFVTTVGQRDHEVKTNKAYVQAQKLGVGHLC